MNKNSFLVGALLACSMGLITGAIYAQKETSADAKAAVKVAVKPTDQQEVNYKIVNIEYLGTKVWVPSVLIAPKGARVNIKLINNAPSGVHGFTIPDFNVQVEVANDKPQEVSFIADKPGMHQINCHMHPAHIGGYLFVTE